MQFTVPIGELAAGEITATAAADKLDLSVRHIKRLKKIFRQKGKDGLIHGARGITGCRKTDKDMEDKIVSVIRTNYCDFGPTLAWEKLHEAHDISLSDETVRAIMTRNGLWTPKRRRRGEYFAWRERRAAYGELVQFDGSYHDWLEGRNPEIPEACLLAAIDDATGKIVLAVFGVNESVTAVFAFWREYAMANGLPKEIYLDKFSTYKINHKLAVDNIEAATQFKRAMDTLGTRLIFANTPQAKGRVERLFQTLQDRLIKEMRLEDIRSLEAANKFLKEKFIPQYNLRFAVTPRSPSNCHRALDISTALRLKSIFAKQYTRGINSDFTVRFHSGYFQLGEVQPITVFRTDKVTIEERIDDSIHIKCKGRYLNFHKLPRRPQRVKRPPLILTTHPSSRRPANDHPWRQRFLT
jgi:transposase